MCFDNAVFGQSGIITDCVKPTYIEDTCWFENVENGVYIYVRMEISIIQQEQVQVQCCFTSTETVGTIRDGEPGTATSAFTQL